MLVTALSLLTAMLALRARIHDVRPAHSTARFLPAFAVGLAAGFICTAVSATLTLLFSPMPEVSLLPGGTGALIEPLACLVGFMVLLGPDLRRNSPRQASLLIAAAVPILCTLVANLFGVSMTAGAPVGLIAAALCEAALSYGRESQLIYSAKSIAVDVTGDGIAVVSTTGTLIEANAMARAALEEMKSAGDAPEAVPERINEMLQVPEASKQLLQTSSKRFLEVWTTSEGATRGRRGVRAIVLRDVTARRIGERKLLQLAHNDSLTGLSNRRRFIDRLKQALLDAAQRDHGVAVLYIDLDRFKEINDTLGHGAGDHLLREVADRLQAPLPLPAGTASRLSQPIVSRLGGDEFAIVLPRLEDEEVAAAAADEILVSVADPIRLNERTMSISASIGIAVSPRDGSDVETLVKHADAALYAAKGLGRNRYAFYRPSYGRASDRNHQIEQELRTAIERNELALHYQPKVDLETQTVSGFEALVRWNNAALGSVGPSEFIPIAEERGLISAIGTWCVREACSTIQSWKAAGLDPVPVSVNVSSAQFNETDVRTIVSEALQEFELNPEILELELTERLILEDNDATAVSLRDLRAIGVRISLDDFGTGYSALTYLNQFPLDIVKMDRGFLREIEDSRSARGIVSAVVSMCHSLGLDVIAEGVDSVAQVERLREMGCRQVQGFLFAPALPSEQILRFLAPVDGLRPIIEPTTKNLEGLVGTSTVPPRDIAGGDGADQAEALARERTTSAEPSSSATSETATPLEASTKPESVRLPPLAPIEEGTARDVALPPVPTAGTEIDPNAPEHPVAEADASETAIDAAFAGILTEQAQAEIAGDDSADVSESESARTGAASEGGVASDVSLHPSRPPDERDARVDDEHRPPPPFLRGAPCVLALGDPIGDVTSVVQRLQRLGVTVHEANTVSEAKPWIADDGMSPQVLLVSPHADLAAAAELGECVAKQPENVPPSILVAGERPDDTRVADIRAGHPRWVLWAPFEDSELRFFLNAACASQTNHRARKPRVPMDATVYIRAGARRDSAVISSLSADGAFIETPDDYNLEDTLHLEMDLPTGRHRVFARVIYRDRGDSHSGFFAAEGIGVEFMDVDAITSRGIQETVDEAAYRYIP